MDLPLEIIWKIVVYTADPDIIRHYCSWTIYKQLCYKIMSRTDKLRNIVRCVEKRDGWLTTRIYEKKYRNQIKCHHPTYEEWERFEDSDWGMVPFLNYEFVMMLKDGSFASTICYCSLEPIYGIRKSRHDDEMVYYIN